MSYTFKSGLAESFFESDPYIPMNIVFGQEDLDVDRIGLYGPNGDLLEIAVSLSTHEIRELTLVHCDSYHISDEGIILPRAEHGILALNMPDHVDVTSFNLEIFVDGIRFAFGCSSSSVHLQMGNVIFGFSEEENKVAEILVSGIAPDSIREMVSVLEFYRSQKDVVVFPSVTDED